MLLGELGGGRQLDPLGIAERALREDGEAAHRLDLVAEQLHPDRLLLRGRIDVEDAPAHRELPALLDLVDAVVTGVGEQHGDVVEVDALSPVQRERLRPQLRVRDLLGEGDRARDHDRGGIVQRVHRGDPQPGQVRRRVEVGLEGGPPGGIEVDGARRQERLQVAGQVPSGAVVGRDHKHRAGVGPVDQRAEQVGPQGARDVRVDRVAGFAQRLAQRPEALISLCDFE